MSARALSAIALVGVGLSLAVSGHAATAPPEWLTRPAMFLHGVGVAFWVGALAPLVAMARTGRRVAPGPEPLFAHRGAGGRRAGADRPRARDRPARKFWRAGRDPLWHHPLVKLALVMCCWSCRAEPVPADAGAGARSPNARPLLALDPARMRRSSLRHSGRRRRLALHAAAADAALPSTRRWRSTSTPTTRCSRCWFRRARPASTISCCS